LGVTLRRGGETRNKKRCKVRMGRLGLVLHQVFGRTRNWMALINFASEGAPQGNVEPKEEAEGGSQRKLELGIWSGGGSPFGSVRRVGVKKKHRTGKKNRLGPRGLDLQETHGVKGDLKGERNL